jgi:hypothetical protein
VFALRRLLSTLWGVAPSALANATRFIEESTTVTDMAMPRFAPSTRPRCTTSSAVWTVTTVC